MPDARTLLQQLLDQVAVVRVHRPTPIKLTKEQLDQLRAKLPAGVASDPAAAYFGAPIVLVDSTTESTPYLDGWIKCPSCGKPAVGHDELPCDLALVFGPFGDYAVSKALYSYAPTFGRGADGVAGLRQLRRELLATIAVVDRVDTTRAIERWEDDGGYCG